MAQKLMSGFRQGGILLREGPVSWAQSASWEVQVSLPVALTTLGPCGSLPSAQGHVALTL